MEIELKDTSDADWWSGSPRSRPDKVGFFPASFVEKVGAQGFQPPRDEIERKRVRRTDVGVGCFSATTPQRANGRPPARLPTPLFDGQLNGMNDELRQTVEHMRRENERQFQKLQEHSQNATTMIVDIGKALGLPEAEYARFKDAPFATTTRVELISALKSRRATVGAVAEATSKHDATHAGYLDPAQLKNVVSDVKRMLSTVPCQKTPGTLHNDKSPGGTREVQQTDAPQPQPDPQPESNDAPAADNVKHAGSRLLSAKVKFDYEAEDETNISISVGDIVVVTDDSDADWWEGYVVGKPDKVRTLLTASSYPVAQL
jgi:hypothetical protein